MSIDILFSIIKSRWPPCQKIKKVVYISFCLHDLTYHRHSLKIKSMRYIKLLIEYDGTNYHGWQSQKGGGTIQDIISQKIQSITGEEIRLTGASRTDAGVHALGQVAVFGSGSRLGSEVIMRALNANLPSDIRILDAEETEDNFHPRYDATRKSYFYIISQSRQHSAFLQRYVWHLHSSVDIEHATEAASLLIGEHDFSSFRGAGCGAKHPVRTVYSLDISRLKEIGFMTFPVKGNFIKITIEANAFLRHMVRNIVGTLMEVGRGRISVAEFSRILDACDRTMAGPTAPAQGLFLEKITY
ncbi:tRNA pseudouridine synthase A [Candidatus Sulfobium mesophilum]|uniref:tRNA pseudouridine synthase A n=1 Tax=Candidatus Sulfobium mesophilum TaxID=2016548 RepID=A0A2U3QK01_9BACT|nr:tRNA pseudouridine synthase A [Candidatus Sulfobium mesophilum]